MLKTNIDKLVKCSVQGTVSNPKFRAPYRVGADGVPRFLPGTGGITYNVKVGDPACGWVADHVEPGVSTTLDETAPEGAINAGYNAFACIGNDVKVVSGEAKGAIGTVTGTHGGAEHVLVDFDDKTLDKLNMDDKFLIRTYGQGFKFLDYPDIYILSLDPRIMKKWKITENKDKTISVPVTNILPAYLMGSGIGKLNPMVGDYDIQTHDPDEFKRLKLDELKLGDFVAVTDHHGNWGRSYLKGSISIGVVVHCDSYAAGHGPGVVNLISSRFPIIKPKIDKKANLAYYLNIGRFRKIAKAKK